MAHRHGSPSRASGGRGAADLLAEGLGWFSIGLGAVEVLAPRGLARWLGLHGKEGLVRAYGVREIANGTAILATRGRGRAPWVWGRVDGDALDIATVASGLHRRNPRRGNAETALGALLGVTALDFICAQALSDGRGAAPVARDYGDRSGFPRPPDAMRGAAAHGPEAPEQAVRAARSARVPETKAGDAKWTR